MPESGRAAAQILLDAASVVDPSVLNGADLVQPVVDDLAKIEGLISVHDLADSGEEPAFTVEVGDLVGAALVVIGHLVTDLAEARGVDRLAIINDVRAQIDG